MNNNKYKITKDISNKIFRNYRELCKELNWDITTGKSKMAQMKVIKGNYRTEQKGNSIIIKEKLSFKSNIIYNNIEDFYETTFKDIENFDKEKKLSLKNNIIYNIYNNININNIDDFCETTFEGNEKLSQYDRIEAFKEIQDIKKIIQLVETNDRNSKYLGNNIIIYLYYMKQGEGNEYVTYTSRQLSDFGFIKQGVTPDYSNSTLSEGRDPMYHCISKETIDCISRFTDKSVNSLVHEVYTFILDRFKRLMRKSYEKTIDVKSREDVIDFSKTEIEAFLKAFGNTTNLMHMRDGIFGVDKDGTEHELSRKEEAEYDKIKTKVFSFFNIPCLGLKKNVQLFRGKIGQIYAHIQQCCEETLGYRVCKRKIFFSPMKDLRIFKITEEDMIKARNDNNMKMKETVKKFFAKKYSSDVGTLKAINLVIDEIMLI